MPWKETCTMDQRMLFIVDYLSGRYTKKGLCRHYGISRPTGDKWIDRYRIHGPEGLDDLSRRPGCHPDTTAPEIVERIIETKLAHQSFGPKKVGMDRLRALEPDEVWPADSTAGKILKRNHLVRERRQRRRVPPDPRALVHCNAPAQSWSADFKGDVPLANGKRCYPLTLTDNHSRFILQCRALSHPTTDAVKPWFEWVFREYGLPETLRTDNGPPFASVAAGGLSQLSKWWIRLGIRPERIRPAKPSENGRHERMHRSLKEAVMRPPARTLSSGSEPRTALAGLRGRKGAGTPTCAPCPMQADRGRGRPVRVPRRRQCPSTTGGWWDSPRGWRLPRACNTGGSELRPAVWSKIEAATASSRWRRPGPHRDSGDPAHAFQPEAIALVVNL